MASSEALAQENQALRGRVAELEERQHFLERVTSAFPGLVYIFDIGEQRNLYANRQLTDMLGYSVEQVQAMGSTLLGQIIHPDDFPGIMASLQRVMEAADGEVVTMDYRVKRASGEWRWLRDQNTVFARDAEGVACQRLGSAQDITEQRQAEDQARLYGDVIHHMQIALNVWRMERPGDLTSFRLIANNPAAIRMGGDQGAEMLGKLMSEVLPGLVTAGVPALYAEVMRSGVAQDLGEVVYGDSQLAEITYNVQVFPLPDQAVGVTFEDITSRKQAEEERVQLQEQVLQAQAAVLAELSTPLIPITDTVVVMPLIGAIDSQRAQQVMEALLEGVGRHGAEVAIIDITGVSVVDTQVANSLLRAAQAVKLLGAQVVLTGISPEVAQTLVGLGASLEGIITRASLQSAIAYAVRTR